jgi:D-apionate oxidoisomerase
MDYGRATLIKDGWKRIIDDSELEANIAKMLRLKPAHVRPAS